LNKILITICGRGGSVGVPQKNVRLMSGKPLIAYTIEFAHQLMGKINADIALSTDCKKIKKVAKEFGLESDYTRPKRLANNHVGKLEVICDIKKFKENECNVEYDYLIDLDITSPIRSITDITDALTALKKNEHALNIFSVNLANRNPYFNMVEDAGNGFVRLVKKSSIILRRQDVPKVFDLNASFYIYRKKFFDLNPETVITDRSLIYEMNHICFDIDSEIDFKIMEFLYSQNLIKINS